MGSAESSDYDQVLDSVLVGPVAVGSYRFVFQARWTGTELDRASRVESWRRRARVWHARFD